MPVTRRLVPLILLSVATAAPAAELAFEEDGWQHQRLALFSRNEFTYSGAALEVASDDSVSMVWRALPEDLWGATRAAWSWQVDEGVPATDLAQKGGDDRDLALYFVFLPEERARALSGAKARELLEEEAARVLIYVWGGQSEAGTMLDSPYLEDRGKTVVLHGAGTGSAEAEVDLAADHESAFGSAPQALAGVAISADSDDTDSAIRARVSDLRVE